jgi:hypothetical protein
MGRYDPKKTLDEENNKLRIICPIFHAETPIATCFKLRDIVWRGDRPPQRQGCQACMRASKCPINNIIIGMMRDPDSDPYYSAEPKVVNLKDYDLEAIARVKVIDQFLRGYTLSDKEQAMIEKANADARAHADGKGVKRTRRPLSVSEEIEEPVRVESSTASAAETGDMAAAINKMIEEK